MSNSELYVIELGGDIGDIVTMHRLVRCKDCGHCLTDCEGRYVCASLRCTTTPDGYCVWAKRRGDDSRD